MVSNITRIYILSLMFSASVVYGGPLDNCKEYAKYGVPGNNGDILCRKGHLLAHDDYYKTPLWVAEHLTSQKANGALRRSGSFKADPELKKGERAERSDYIGSGFDQGHMAPSADMAWDRQAMKESFYLSNAVPQDPNMNQQIWRVLEDKVRNWALERGELYIYTGPIYSGEEVDVIGDNEVAVPTHIYKVVFDPKKVESIAFIMPNEPLSTSDISNYITTVRDVETQTGLDFLKTLKKSVEDVVETEKAQEIW